MFIMGFRSGDRIELYGHRTAVFYLLAYPAFKTGYASIQKDSLRSLSATKGLSKGKTFLNVRLWGLIHPRVPNVPRHSQRGTRWLCFQAQPSLTSLRHCRGMFGTLGCKPQRPTFKWVFPLERPFVALNERNESF